MANRHFGKLADVWKHLPLAEILAIEEPDHYCETHAGSAFYGMVGDPERRFGVLRLLEIAAADEDLAGSRYLRRLRDFEDPDGLLATYPGSALIAMLELGRPASYLLCDLDPDSVASLESAAGRLGLPSARCLAADGMGSVDAYVKSASGRTLVHIDPFDPTARGPCGLSALDLAGRLIQNGTGLMYWYGYDNQNESAWALDALGQRVDDAHDVWCGDVMVTGPGIDASGGDLGIATTPGTGFGIVCANLSPEAISACERLGHALESTYSKAMLPTGKEGGIKFTVATG